MVPDVEKIEENRLKFPAALYEIASEYLATNDVPGGIICISDGMWVIGDRAGLTRQETDHATNDLLKSPLVIAQTAIDETGPRFSLTQEGCRVAEQYLYEKSSLAKRRKFVGAIKEKSAAGAASILKEAGKWLGGIVIGAAGATYGSAITEWVKEMLSIK
jgi:hypothetical protein